MYEQVFKNIDEKLREDAGCSSELDYIEQTSWILFLKYLDNYENEVEKQHAGLDGKPYKRIIKGEYRWNEWAAPKIDGKIDPKALTDKDLLEFVKDKLFPHLADFKTRTDNPRSLEYKIGEIFGDELQNKIQKGGILRDIIDEVDKLKFLSTKDKHELSGLYEEKINNMGNAGRNGGEYYTPRPVIESMVKIIDPQIGETVYDGAVGSAGFLCEAFTWMNQEKTPSEREQLQKETFFGNEKKRIAYVVGIMNMILHGIESPNIIHTNTLEKDIAEIQDKDRHDVVLANPPFGGKEGKEVKENFPIKSGETAYLFLQHFIKMLKTGGRGGVVIKNTFLSNTNKASVALRKQLLTECNLFAVLDLPPKVFTCTDIKTVVLFFNKGEPTKKVWFYELNLDRNLGKRNPINAKDLADFENLFKKKESSENSWFVNIKDINKETWNLTPKNPNKIVEIDSRTQKQIIEEVEKLDTQANQALQAIKELL